MLSVRTELRYQCKQTVASTLITDPLVKTPLPAAKLLKRQLLVFPQVATRVSQEATKACRKRNAKGLPQPRPTTVTTWQHHESHPPFHLRLPEPKGACKERWIPWIMVMWNAFIVMCKDVEFTIYIYIYSSPKNVPKNPPVFSPSQKPQIHFTPTRKTPHLKATITSTKLLKYLKP